MKLRNIIPVLTLMLFAFSSCKKFVDIDPPISNFVASTAFTTDELVEADIAGMYSYNLLSSSYHDIYRHLFPGFSSDELLMYTTTYDEFTNNSILPANTISRYMWSEPYKAIYQSNLILTGLQNADHITPKVRNEALGVARFFRALCYLNLVSIFGDVPLVISTDPKISGSQPRAPKEEVFKLIIEDLKEAKVLLREVSKGTGWATEPVAAALLARAYLYNGQFTEAAAEANELISGSLRRNYQLETLANAFLRSSKETIFAISTDGSSRVTIGYTYAGVYYLPSSTVRVTYFLRDDLLNAFEANDQRKVQWVRQFTAREPYNWYPYKYKRRTSPTVTTEAEDQVLIRLAEMYLIRAESYAQTNRLTEAIADLNSIRRRAGLGNLPETLTKDEILLAVEKERRVELFSEYGHRWVDLVRTGRANTVLGTLKGSSWENHAVLYPVPDKDIELNPNLTQNPGYGR